LIEPIAYPMKIIFTWLFVTILFICLATGSICAGTQYDVSGTVTNEKGEPLKGATVFISGSELVTPTDEDGRFEFKARYRKALSRLSVTHAWAMPH
jgi:hypothetical protein